MAENDESILTLTKKALGIPEAYDVFDSDILMQINAVFSSLHSLGIGPDAGFYVEDAEKKWSDFILDEKHINSVKALMVMKVKLAFDPPPTSFGIDALERQIREYEWRLNVHVDGVKNVGHPTY